MDNKDYKDKVEKIFGKDVTGNTIIKDSPEEMLQVSKNLIKSNNKKIHILLVDDDEALLRLFGGYLNKAGFEVLYAHDGNEGRESARKLKPDLILLDLTIPVMDGYEVSARLKAEEPTKDIPIALLTSADITPEAEKMFKERGVEDYIHKSVTDVELIERVKNILKNHGYILEEEQLKNVV